MSEAAKTNLTVLKTMQNLAKGAPPPTTPMIPMGNNSLPHHHLPHDYHDDDEGSVNSESSYRASDVDSAAAKATPDRKYSDGLDFLGGLDSDMSLGGQRLSDLSSHSLLKGHSSTQVMVGSPQAKSTDQLTTPSSYGGRKISQESTPTTIPNVSSQESLESAGDLAAKEGTDGHRHSGENGELSEDSDLAPGDTSAVTSVRPDVTQLGADQAMITTKSALGFNTEGGRSFKREVSFDIDNTDNNKVLPGETAGQQQKKSNLRADSVVSNRTRKTSSAKSVTIDPAVPDDKANKSDAGVHADANQPRGKSPNSYTSDLVSFSMLSILLE